MAEHLCHGCQGCICPGEYRCECGWDCECPDYPPPEEQTDG